MRLLFVMENGTDGQQQLGYLPACSIEEALNILNGLKELGMVLPSACFVDRDDSRLALPVEALDGTPVGPQLQLLQAQWQQALRVY